jgi:hypothetical protein
MAPKISKTKTKKRGSKLSSLLKLGDGTHLHPYATKKIKKNKIRIFFPFVLLLLGASGFHHQLSTKRELGLPLC